MTEISNLLPDRSIGKKLKNAREGKAYSIDEVSSSTKIRSEYIKAIEEDNFTKFDSHVYAKGFIKNYALFLDLDPEPMIALYRRDYENLNEKRKVKQINETTEVKKNNVGIYIKNNITKRRISYSIFSLMIIVISGSLLLFLQTTFTPPFLKITSPEIEENDEYEKISTDKKSLRISGETNPNTLIKVNEEPVPLKPGNTFETDFLPLTSENNIVVIEAQSPLGIKRTMKIEFIRSDLENQKKVEGDALIMIKEKPVFVLIRADGIIKFNDIAVPNEVINITADKFIEIESSEPQYINLQINDDSFQLSKIFERFELGEKIVRLN